MRTRSLVIVTALIVALLVAAGAVYAYDSGRDDLISEGVRIEGIEVGGLRAGEARALLRRELVEPLAEPVVVRGHGRKFRLSPAQARVGVNVDRAVGQAVEASRDGGILDRTVRGLTGGKVHQDVDVEVTYDRSAVDRLVARVRKAVEREPEDADVGLSPSGVSVERSRDGVALRAAKLRRDVASQLLARDGDRRVRLRTRSVEPEITTEELGERYPSIIIVNRGSFKLTLYRKLKPAKTYRIAVGQAGLETPAGEYRIQNMAIDPAWHVPDSDWAGDLAGKVIPPGPENPIKARWMGIYDGAGIHGTDAISSLGTAASHGCIRMAIPDVKELYDQVQVGAPVYIA